MDNVWAMYGQWSETPERYDRGVFPGVMDNMDNGKIKAVI